MSRAYSSTPLDQLAVNELIEILLTCDGRGRDVKREALVEIIAWVSVPAVEPQSRKES